MVISSGHLWTNPTIVFTKFCGNFVWTPLEKSDDGFHGIFMGNFVRKSLNPWPCFTEKILGLFQQSFRRTKQVLRFASRPRFRQRLGFHIAMFLQFIAEGLRPHFLESSVPKTAMFSVKNLAFLQL